MNEELKCLDAMDFSACWSDWRTGFKNVIQKSKTYYQDETVQNLLNEMDSFLIKNVCPETSEEKLINEMWEIATIDERRTLATLFLKMANKI